MSPLSAALLLAASWAFAREAPLDHAQCMARLSQAGAQAQDAAQAKAAADAAAECGAPPENAVDADGRTIRRRKIRYSDAPAGPQTTRVPAPPSAPAEEKKGFFNGPMGLGLSAGLGALQGWFTHGLKGALAGGVIGLAAAYLFQKGDIGGFAGVSIGAIIGSFLGGPIGALIGAALGGVAGHFIGKALLR